MLVKFKTTYNTMKKQWSSFCAFGKNCRNVYQDYKYSVQVYTGLDVFPYSLQNVKKLEQNAEHEELEQMQKVRNQNQMQMIKLTLFVCVCVKISNFFDASSLEYSTQNKISKYLYDLEIQTALIFKLYFLLCDCLPLKMRPALK